MRAKRFTAVFFLSMLAGFMCLVFAGIAMRAAEKLTTSSNEVNIDWEKLYPFEVEVEENEIHEPEQRKSYVGSRKYGTAYGNGCTFRCNE